MRLRSLRAGAALAALLACDDGTAAAPATPAFEIVPSPFSAASGVSVRLGVRWLGAPPPDARVAWSVAPASLGTVDADGVFTAGPTGGVGVVAATVHTGGRTASRVGRVTVVGPDCTTTVQWTPVQGSVAVGGRLTLRARVTRAAGCERSDSLAVDFAALDPAIATVDAQGVVTGVRVGRARIRVSAAREPAVFGLALVDVLAPAPFADPPLPTPSSLAMVAGDTARITAIVPLAPNAPAGLPRGVRFASRDSTVATVDSTGLVRAIGAGQTLVVVRALADTALFTGVPVTVRPR